MITDYNKCVLPPGQQQDEQILCFQVSLNMRL